MRAAGAAEAAGELGTGGVAQANARRRAWGGSRPALSAEIANSSKNSRAIRQRSSRKYLWKTLKLAGVPLA